MRHPLDSPAAHRAAAFLGWLGAAGLVDAAEARAALAAAVRRTRGVDPSGLAARLAHAFADSRGEAVRRRRAAQRRIRTRLAPLLDAGAGGAAILDAAAAAADDSLLPGEARALATAMVAAWLGRGG